MKRTALKRRTRLKPRSKQAIKDKELDALCRKLVFLRDGNRCVKTGSTHNLQWAHIFSRRFKSLRWDEDNSMCLSAGAHLWWHHQPLEAAKWFTEKYPERAKRLEMLRLISQSKIDRTIIKLRLEAEIEKYEQHAETA